MIIYYLSIIHKNKKAGEQNIRPLCSDGSVSKYLIYSSSSLHPIDLALLHGALRRVLSSWHRSSQHRSPPSLGLVVLVVVPLQCIAKRTVCTLETRWGPPLFWNRLCSKWTYVDTSWRHNLHIFVLSCKGYAYQMCIQLVMFFPIYWTWWGLTWSKLYISSTNLQSLQNTECRPIVLTAY